MKKFTKILALVLAAVLLVAGTFAATVAWLTADAGEKKNVFTAGNVNIELKEEVGVEGDGATVTPVVDEDGVTTGHKYEGAMPGDYLIKKPTVTNTGDVPAYVAITVTVNNADLINLAIDEVYENDPYKYSEEEIQAIYDEVFVGWGLNYSKTDALGNALGMRLTITGADMPEKVLHVDSVKTIDEYAQFYTGNWFGEQEDIIPFDGLYTSDMGEYEIKYVYYALLQPEESVTVFEGLQVPTDFDNDQIKMFDDLTIDVSAVAIQADNIPNAQYAFAYYYGIEDTTELPVTAASADELVEALENGEDVLLTENVKIDPANMSNAYGKTGINVKNGQTIDGNGNTLDIEGAGGTWDSGINTTGGTIKNLTVTGSFRGIFINHNSENSEPVILENVVIDGTVYTISCDQGKNQNLLATGSTFNGWTSYAATLGEATFIDCDFGEGSGYAFCRPYAPTTFVDCDFEAGYEMDPRAAVTFENCTLGGEPLTADNLATLVTSNIANATVK